MSSLDRGENLGRLRAGGTWDIVVIGGGATGLGAAVDAAARGYRTALLEARDVVGMVRRLGRYERGLYAIDGVLFACACPSQCHDI